MSDNADKPQMKLSVILDSTNDPVPAVDDLITTFVQDREKRKADTVCYLEQQYNKGKLITYKEMHDDPLYKDYQFLMKWLFEIVPYGNIDNSILMFTEMNRDRIKLHLYLFTETNQYSVTAYPSIGGNDKGYLGCILTRRKTRVGEKHHRGSDLPDGPYSKSTWNAIKRAIIKTELKRLQIFDS